MLKISLFFKKNANFGYITRDLLGLRMRKFQGMIFKWIPTCREIFKSALVKNRPENP